MRNKVFAAVLGASTLLSLPLAAQTWDRDHRVVTPWVDRDHDRDRDSDRNRDRRLTEQRRRELQREQARERQWREHHKDRDRDRDHDRYDRNGYYR